MSVSVSVLCLWVCGCVPSGSILKVSREHVSRLIYPPQFLGIALAVEDFAEGQAVFYLSIKETTSVVESSRLAM